MIVAIVILSVFLMVIAYRYFRLRGELNRLNKALGEIRDGNLNLRFYSRGVPELMNIPGRIDSLLEKTQSTVETMLRSHNNQKVLISNISHDLRTPLTSIVGYLDAINRGVGVDRDRYLEIVNSKARSLMELVEDLFFLTRIDSGDIKIETEPLDIAELLRQVWIEFIPEIEKRNIIPEVSIPDKQLIAQGDRHSLPRVFRNLIANSLKHAEGVSTVGISLGVNDEHILIDVWDDGPGIDQTDIPKLFTRAYSRDLSRGGGLGLPIAMDIIERHKGDIKVISKPHQRTIFRVDLPIGFTDGILF